jgi:hypothetical protein
LDLPAGTDNQISGSCGEHMDSAHAGNWAILPAIYDDLDLVVVLL